MKEENKDIAVIGISGRFPEADNLEQFWENLVAGRDSIRLLPASRRKELKEAAGQGGSFFEKEFMKCGYLDRIFLFEPGYFNISEEESKYMDPQHRLALELVEEALQDAGYNSENLSGKNVGVFMALSKNTYGTFIGSSPLGLVNKTEAALAGRIAYTFNFFGPALSIDTACSSSLAALHYACLSLSNDQCAYAIAGGVNIKLIPGEISTGKFSPITSKSQYLRAFDKKADGTLGGEGGGIVVLKKIKDALADRDTIHAIIKGSGINSDGARSNGMSAPNPDAQAQLIRKVMENSGIHPSTISYIEAHGTGTELGDPIEVEGITKAFSGWSDKKQYIPIGSVKTNIGHLDSAAGIAGLMKVILALKNKKIPPSLHFEDPNPYIDFKNSPVFVNDKLTDWKSPAPRRAGVTSLGIIGTNVHAILEEAPALQPNPLPPGNTKKIFTWSTRTAPSLERMISNFKRYVRKNPHLPLENAAFTLNTGRRQLPYRFAVCAGNREELGKKLEIPFVLPRLAKVKYSPVFIYPGLQEEFVAQPGDLPGQKMFRTHYDECIRIGGADSRSKHFAFQYACSKTICALGVKPKAVFGIGWGKFIADVIQGKCSLPEGLFKSKEYSEKNETVDQERLDEIIDRMLEKKYNLFLDFGGSGMIEQTLNQKAVGEHNLRRHSVPSPDALTVTPGLPGIPLMNDRGLFYIPVHTADDSFYSAVRELYGIGFDIDWGAFYPGQEYRRISLPTYVFDRKNYFLKVDFSPGLAPSSKEGHEQGILGQGVNENVTFEEILAIFQTRIQDPLGLNLEYDFESNGGDSLSVMEIVEVLKLKYHITLEINLFYTTPTLKELITRILKEVREKGEPVKHRQGTGKFEVLLQEKTAGGAADTEISSDLSEISTTEEMPVKILITGSTGFFGAHLLMELIEKTNAEIYCLTRGDSPEAARWKIKRIWDFYFGNQWEKYLDEKIFIVEGDITESYLGLGKSRYDRLEGMIDTVIHSAADVRHHGKYEHFKKVNVEGTKNVLDFCLSGRDKKLHHISTLAVAGIPREGICFREHHLDIGQDFGGQVYATTKYEAEILVRQARKKGLKASVYRIGNLVGRFKDGVFQENIQDNQLYNHLKAITLLGKIPSQYLGRAIEITPVDLCSCAAVKLILLKDAVNHNFHLMHPTLLSMKDLIAVIRKDGYPVEVVDARTFALHVKSEVQAQKFVKEISRIFYYLRDEEESEMISEVEDKETGTVRQFFDNAFTVRVLAKSGFLWPELNAPYLEKMFRHCEEVGYIIRGLAAP